MEADEIFLAALAMMDHPNIAKVLDAGTTGSEPAAPERDAAMIRS